MDVRETVFCAVCERPLCVRCNAESTFNFHVTSALPYAWRICLRPTGPPLVRPASASGRSWGVCRVRSIVSLFGLSIGRASSWLPSASHGFGLPLPSLSTIGTNSEPSFGGGRLPVIT